MQTKYGVIRYPLKGLSLLLLVIAAVYWLAVVSVVHPLVRLNVRLGRHDAVRRVVGRGSRVGYSVFRLWGMRIASNHAHVRLPENRPIVLVASHHSSLDMCFLLGLLQDAFGRRNLRFVSRPGLDKGIPTISHYIKQYCYSLSSAGDFKARRQKEDKLLMGAYCRQLNAENGVLTIFPEGIKPRSQPEHSRHFSTTGLSVILDNMPDALIVPLAIKGTGEFYCTPRKWSHFLRGVPRFGVSVKVSMLPPLEPADYPDSVALIRHCEALIHREYGRLKQGQSQQGPLMHGLSLPGLRTPGGAADDAPPAAESRGDGRYAPALDTECEEIC